MLDIKEVTSILYFNGMNSVRLSKREYSALDELAHKGYDIRHIPIDWQSSETFESLIERSIQIVHAELEKNKNVLIIGASAGGTLIINMMARLQDTSISAISICGRHVEKNIAKWDPRTIKRMAFINERRASQSFYDAVMNCQNVAIPELSNNTKERILCVKPLLDEVVSRRTMDISGIKTYTIPRLGHHNAIVASLYRLPYILDKLGGSS